MSQKSLDNRGRWRNKTIAFHVSPAEWNEIHERADLSGMSLQNYLIRSTIYQQIVFVGSKKNLNCIQDKMDVIIQELKRIQTAGEADEELLTPLWLIMEILEAAETQK